MSRDMLIDMERRQITATCNLVQADMETEVFTIVSYDFQVSKVAFYCI